MIILTWNVRGLGDSIKRGGIRDLCQLNKVDIICIQESKHDSTNEFVFRSIGGSSINNWEVKHAFGSSGGLITG